MKVNRLRQRRFALPKRSSRNTRSPSRNSTYVTAVSPFTRLTLETSTPSLWRLSTRFRASLPQTPHRAYSVPLHGDATFTAFPPTNVRWRGHMTSMQLSPTATARFGTSVTPTPCLFDALPSCLDPLGLVDGSVIFSRALVYCKPLEGTRGQRSQQRIHIPYSAASKLLCLLHSPYRLHYSLAHLRESSVPRRNTMTGFSRSSISAGPCRTRRVDERTMNSHVPGRP